MVTVVQLVRASDCGSECRGFESHQSPQRKQDLDCNAIEVFFFLYCQRTWNIPSIPLPLTIIKKNLGEHYLSTRRGFHLL